MSDWALKYIETLVIENGSSEPIQKTITFYSNVWLSPVIYRDTRNWMLNLWLAWVHKVYQKTKVFSKKVTFSNKWSLNSPFSCYTHSMLGLRLDWQCFNKVWVNFVNPILSLRLAWLHKVYHKTQNFQKKRK